MTSDLEKTVDEINDVIRSCYGHYVKTSGKKQYQFCYDSFEAGFWSAVNIMGRGKYGTEIPNGDG